MSAKKSVELFYDVLSPYSWFGFETICRYQHKWNIALQLKPMLLGAVMVASENQPPGMNPARGAYMARDLHRLRQYYHVPLQRPKDFMGTVIMKGSMSAMRLLTAASITTPDKLEPLSRAVWMRIWNKDEDITEPASLQEACLDAGFTAEGATSLVSMTKDPKVKATLKEVTQEAIDHGAFGAPTFIVEGVDGKKHMVFGSDRFHVMAMLLGEQFEGPLNELAKTKL